MRTHEAFNLLTRERHYPQADEGDPGERTAAADDDFDFPVPEKREVTPAGESAYLGGYYVTNRHRTYQLQTDRGAVNGTLDESGNTSASSKSNSRAIDPWQPERWNGQRKCRAGSFPSVVRDGQTAANTFLQEAAMLRTFQLPDLWPEAPVAMRAHCAPGERESCSSSKIAVRDLAPPPVLGMALAPSRGCQDRDSDPPGSSVPAGARPFGPPPSSATNFW